MIVLVVARIWQVLAETADRRIARLASLVRRAYVQGVAGECVPCLSRGYFDKYPSPLKGLIAWQSGLFFCARWIAGTISLIVNDTKRAADARGL